MPQNLFDRGTGGRDAVDHAVMVIFFVVARFPAVPCAFMKVVADRLDAGLDKADGEGHLPASTQQIGDDDGIRHMHRSIADGF